MEVSIGLLTKDKQSHTVTMNIPSEPIPLEDLVHPFRILLDKIISLETIGKKISCKKGCSACCNQLIPLSIPEVFYLNRHMGSLTAAHKKRIRKRFARNKNRLNKAGLLAAMKDPAAVVSLDKEYFDLELPCPFLESSCCSIYESRPFVCMEYFVISPPELCSHPYTTPVDKIKTNLNIGALLAAFSARLLNLSRTPVPLIIFPDWAENFEKLRIKKYPAQWMFKKLLHALSEVHPEEGNTEKIRITW